MLSSLTRPPVALISHAPLYEQTMGTPALPMIQFAHQHQGAAYSHLMKATVTQMHPYAPFILPPPVAAA